MFGMDSVGKYSVQIGIFIDWEVVRLPPLRGDVFLIVYVYDTIYGVVGVVAVRFVEFGGGYVGVITCLYL